jgi:hypothetical protein
MPSAARAASHRANHSGLCWCLWEQYSTVTCAVESVQTPEWTRLYGESIGSGFRIEAAPIYAGLAGLDWNQLDQGMCADAYKCRDQTRASVRIPDWNRLECFILAYHQLLPF